MTQSSFAFRLACMAAFALQNSTVSLLMRYSRGVLRERYSLVMTVAGAELLKLVFSLIMLLVGARLPKAVGFKQLLPRLGRDVLLSREMINMVVPGALYFGMNQLVFVGLQHLQASTFALVSQTKILTAAIFARLLLGRQLHWYQWRALFLLVIGVVLVQSIPAPMVPTIADLRHAAGASLTNVRAWATGAETLDPQTSTNHTAALSESLTSLLYQNDRTSVVETFRHLPREEQHRMENEVQLLLKALELTEQETDVSAPPMVAVPAEAAPAPAPAASSTNDGAARRLLESIASPSIAPVSAAPPVSPSASSDETSTSRSGQAIGLLATVLAAVLSGFCGAYVERALKAGTPPPSDQTEAAAASTTGPDPPLSLWDRNVQLAFYGLFFGLLQGLLFSTDAEREFVATHGWFGGFSVWTWLIMVLNGGGGILIALVLVYLDNIVRGFCTTVAIILTTAVSSLAFGDVDINIIFCCGVGTVVLAVANYSTPPSEKEATTAPPAPNESEPTSPLPSSATHPPPVTQALLAEKQLLDDDQVELSVVIREDAELAGRPLDGADGADGKSETKPLDTTVGALHRALDA